MAKYRIVVGQAGVFGYGYNYTADTPKEAVQKCTKDLSFIDPSYGGVLGVSNKNDSKILSVYELVPVPETEWS